MHSNFAYAYDVVEWLVAHLAESRQMIKADVLGVDFWYLGEKNSLNFFFSSFTAFWNKVFEINCIFMVQS